MLFADRRAAVAGGFDPADLTGFVEAWVGSSLSGVAATADTWPGLTGAHDLTQATAAARPQIETDAGKRYALFDGVDDFILKNPYTQGSAAGHSIFVSVRMTASGNFPIFFASRSAVREMRCSGTSRIPQHTTNNGGGAVSAPDPGGVLTIGTDYVVGVTVDFATDAVAIYIDGVQVATGTDNTDPTSLTSSILCIGARSDGTLPLPARVYGATYCEAALSPAEVASLTTYLQGLHP